MQNQDKEGKDRRRGEEREEMRWDGRGVREVRFIDEPTD